MFAALMASERPEECADSLFAVLVKTYRSPETPMKETLTKTETLYSTRSKLVACVDFGRKTRLAFVPCETDGRTVMQNGRNSECHYAER